MQDNDVLSDKMFEQGQTIMLMGSAESTDVASHLDPSKLEHPVSTSNGESTEVRRQKETNIYCLFRCSCQPG